MTPYQAQMFLNLESLPAGKWYSINPERADLKEFTETLILRIETWGDIDMSTDKKKFKRINPMWWDAMDLYKEHLFASLAE